MRPILPEQTSPEANPILLPPLPEGVLPVHCPECRLPLSIHEPDPASPRAAGGDLPGLPGAAGTGPLRHRVDGGRGRGPAHPLP